MRPRLAVIITALPVERESVIEHLRDVSEEPELRGSIYRCGVFEERSQPWKIIVAEIGAGNEGAAAEAERVISHYSPEVALFVGIAGAVKDLKHGDVVASTKVYGYESGKDAKGGFEARPAVQLSAYALEQRSRFESAGSDWRQRIRRVGEPAHAVVPDARVAPIAAGEKVVASNRSLVYKFIRNHYGDAVAVEMEGHGFLLGVHMNHPTQGMVIRGISDLVDDKDATNDETWQPIAARHAAAFAFQLLAKLPPAESGKSQSAAGAGTLQQISVGNVSGDNNTLNIHQGLSIEYLERLIQAAAPNSNAEIDAACAHLTAGEFDIAIHMLSELRKKRWDRLTPRERYRVAANTGHALERKGEFRAAARHYMEAKENQPHDEKARAFEAIAYYHLDDKKRAYELAGEVLKDHPNCSIAIAARIRSAPRDVQLASLEGIIPTTVCEELDILHALGWRALASGDLAAAERIANTALKRNPDSDEIKEFMATVVTQVESKATLSNRPVNRERLGRAVQALSEGIAKHRGRRDVARLRYMRAEAYDLLGMTAESETDFRTAFDADMDEPDVVRRFTLFLERHDRRDAAIDVLRRSDKVKQNHTNRLILSGLLGERKGKGDWESAISLLRETIPQKPEPEIRAAMVAHLTHLMGLQTQHEEALAYLDGLDTHFLRPSVFSAIRSRVFLRAGRKHDAVACAKQATESLNADSPESDRMRVAESLGFVGEKQEALKLWKQVLQPDHVDPLVRMALGLAWETGDDTFIMSFCKQLRAAGVQSSFTTELEVVTLEKYRMRDAAIAVMNGYLAVTPEDDLARAFRVRLSLLGLRFEMPELVETDTAKLPSVESVPVNIGAATAHVLRNGPHPEHGVTYAYELVRRYFDDPVARQAYVGIVGIGDDEHRFPKILTVAPGCAVKYRADDTGDEKWVIIEDAGNPRSERDEISPSHIWADQMCGKSVGEKFYLRHDELQSRTATIQVICSKYVYRKLEIIDGWEERFPDQFFVRKYTFPTNKDGSPDISLILRALDLREQQKDEMHAFYRANPISATTFARVANTGLLESLSHLASEDTLPIRCCFGNAHEFARAQAALSGSETIVLEPSALATLFFSDQYEQLQLLKGNVVICESALDEYTELRRKVTSPSRGFMGKFKGTYLFREDDPIERQKEEQRLDKFFARIPLLVEMRTGENLARLAPERREELIGLFGEPTAQAMAEAAVTGAVLWTDDLAVAEVGRERDGIQKRVWTQLVLKSVATQDDYANLTLFLLQWRYTFTRVEPGAALAACHVGAWDPDAPVLKQIADWLNQPYLLDESATRLCVQFLRIVWDRGPETAQKQNVSRLFLQAIRRRHDGRQAIKIILNNLGEIFRENQAARNECESVINQLLRAEKTPEELAASKAAWGNAVQKLGKKWGLPVGKQGGSNWNQRAKMNAGRKRRRR